MAHEPECLRPLWIEERSEPCDVAGHRHERSKRRGYQGYAYLLGKHLDEQQRDREHKSRERERRTKPRQRA